jgi:hypothetical protein
MLFNIQRPNGTWVYNPSLALKTFLNASLVFKVIDGGTARFWSGTQYYRYIAYVVLQSGNCDGQVAGFMHVMFSQNGTTWSNPVVVDEIGANESFPCFGVGVPIEALGVYYDNTDTLFIIALEGNIAVLNTYQLQNNTFTYLYTASRFNPTAVTYNLTLSPIGLFSPNLPGYWLPRFFINIDFVYNPVNLSVYITRSYSYPYDPNTNGVVSRCTACGNAGLPVATLPNRGQIYKMYIGGNPNVLGTGTWTKLADWGVNRGYPYWNGTQCSMAFLVPGQTYIQNTDVDGITLERGPRGEFTTATAYTSNKTRTYTNCVPAPYTHSKFSFTP